MGVGAIIGAGIFVLTGTAAALYAGPAIVLSFVLAAIACGLVGLCYAELSAFLPVSGSSYTYTYATLGELAAWVIGWDLILEYAMGGATVAVGWSGYFNSVLGLAGLGLPPRLGGGDGAGGHAGRRHDRAAIANLPAAGIVVLITALLVLGTRKSARLNNIMVTVKLTVVLAFIVLGAAYVKPPTGIRSFRPMPASSARLAERHPARRLDRVLRLYRLRCRLQLRTGGAAAAARHADRHPGLARRLDHPLHRRRHGPDRPGAVSRAQRGRSRRQGGARHRTSNGSHCSSSWAR